VKKNYFIFVGKKFSKEFDKKEGGKWGERLKFIEMSLR
jgi:hypothetical protein